MSWEQASSSEPPMVPLTERMMQVRPSELATPEELLIASQSGEDGRRRRMSPAMRRALCWLTLEPPERVSRMLAWLPLEEAYCLRRYLLHGDSQMAIAKDVGVTQVNISLRLRRSLWRLREVSDLAWDIGEREMRAAIDFLPALDLDVLVRFWQARFSQRAVSRVYERTQGWVWHQLQRIMAAIAERVKESKLVSRIHATLVEVTRRRLWRLAPMPRSGHRLTLPR